MTEYLAATVTGVALFAVLFANEGRGLFSVDEKQYLSRPPYPRLTVHVDYKDELASPVMFRGDAARTGGYGERTWAVKGLRYEAINFENIGLHSATKGASAFDEAGFIYVNDGGELRRQDINGQWIWSWRNSSADKGYHQTPSQSASQIFLTGYDGHLTVFRKSDGRPVLNIFSADFIGSSPLLIDDQVVVSVESAQPDGYVYKFDLKQRQALWVSEWLGDHPHSSPAIDPQKQRIFVGVNSGDLVALGFESGKTDWKFKTQGAIKSTPTVTESGVYFTSMDGYLYALNLNGELRWKAPVLPRLIASSTVIVLGESTWVIAPDAAGLYSAWSATTGEREWASTERADGASNHVTWSRHKGRAVAWVGCAPQSVCALDASNGKTLAKYEVGCRVSGELVPAADRIMGVCESGSHFHLRINKN